MNNGEYQLYCCGSRGSRPVEGRRFNEFGGFTTCYVLKRDDYALIIDCGTGLYEANAIVLDCSVIDVVLTHMHYDHMLGMLDWAAIPRKAKVTFYSGFEKWFGSETFAEFFRKPFWPVQPDFVLKETPTDNTSLVLRSDLQIDFYPAPHPNESQLMIIKATFDGDEGIEEHRIVIMFDCEKSDGLDKKLISGCDYLLYDGMYTDEEYHSRIGYGHSTWQEGCRLATKVNCRRLIITHHDPNRVDDELRQFERLARDIYPDTDFARSGQSWSFPRRQTVIKVKPKSEKKRIELIVKKINKRFNEIVLNDDARMRFMGVGCYVLLGLVSLFMSAVNYFTDKQLLMYATLIFCILCTLNVILDRVLNVNYKVVQTIFQVEMLILVTFFLVSGIPEGFSATWILMLPVAGMLVFGKKRNTALCAIMFVILIFFLEVPYGRSLLQYKYTDSFMLRFPMAYAAFYAIAYFLETIRERTFNELETLKNNQAITIANQTSELREQNFNMLRANSRLQLRNKILRKYAGNNLSDDEIQELLNKEGDEINNLD